MKKNALIVWALLAGLLWCARADAQPVFTKRTLGFETAGCGNTALTLPDTDVLFGRYQELPSNAFLACGISSITSTSDGITAGKQRYHDPNGTISGMTGSIVMAGAIDLTLPLTQTNITISFAPAVNELKFDVLDLNNTTGLTVTLNGASGVLGAPQNPSADGSGIVHFSTVSTTPITSVVLTYLPSSLPLDGWYVDQVYYNAWHCGDGEPESTSGATEQCDDGNEAPCDGCTNDCKTIADGCLYQGSCVPAGAVAASSGCATCNVPTPKNGALQLNTGSCNSGNFCSVSETCNAGVCQGTPRNCADTADCTDDTCDEVGNACTHAVKQGSCLIAGTCYTNGETNIDAPCERCDRSKANNAWSLKPDGSRCGDPSCMDGILTPFPQCSASGLCEAQMPVSCDGAVCADSISCDGACQGDNDCVEETHCVAGVCVPDVPIGEPCERASQCDSNFCADGVCCDDVCDGACVSCGLNGKTGMCSAHASGTDPDDDCPDAQYCGDNAKCVGENRPNGTECAGDAYCASGHCADGVCCNLACDGTCEACNSPGQLGVCTAFAAGTDPANECSGDAVCSGEGTCVSYETRGNGLCVVSNHGRNWASALATVFALCALLGARRSARFSARAKSRRSKRVG